MRINRTLVIGLALICLSPLAWAGELKAVATISIIGDIVKNVAGDLVDVSVLVGPDGDAHGYEPNPADSVSIARADVIFENGLHLEHWLDKLYMASGSKAKRAVLSHGVPLRSLADNPQEIDPHAWQNVTNAMIYTTNVRDMLTALDPSHQETYTANAEKYIAQLQALDEWVKSMLAKVPVDQRKLVTNHDAFGYFAHHYGFSIIGAVIPSATTEAVDPSARQTVQLLNIIKSHGVRVIFCENTANTKLAETLAREAGAEVVSNLYTDALGGPGSKGDTYINMIRHNVEVVAKYLTPSK